MTKHRQLSGTVIGSWTVESKAPRQRSASAWYCRCVCGVTRVVLEISLVNGASLSCGCMPRTRPALSVSTLEQEPGYRAWVSMRRRCNSPTDRAYPRYGGKGIRVCLRWDDFRTFQADIGPRPSPKHSIDRIDNEGDYEPSNCRWATPKEQSRNTRQNIAVVRSDGVLFRSISEVTEKTGLTYYDVRRAIDEGIERGGFFWSRAA